MLEIIFSEGAAASLACAQSKEIKAAMAGALPLGSREDICSFPLYLGFGAIDEEGIGPLREQAIASLMGIYPAEGSAAAKELLQTARASLKKLLARAKAGEPLRIWASGQPDDACGLCWLMGQLAPLHLDELDTTLILLPEFSQMPGGTVVLHSGWAELTAQEWSRMAKLGKKIPAALLQSMASCWQELRAQNAPLRAVLNGRLISAPLTLYDSIILRELEAEPEEFLEARLIGKLIGKYHLGLGDAFFALRIEQFISDGILQEAASPAPGDPIYHRWLKKKALA